MTQRNFKIDFSYAKQNIEFTQSFINKGRNYRESLIKFHSLYKFNKKGTETNEIFLFEPKGKTLGVVLILHGLGTKNITYILKMGRYFSKLGIRAVVPILPDNYTRTSNGSMSGKNYFSADIYTTLNTWEHAVVDVLSIIDFLKANELWHERNFMIGYCLGGMVSVIVNSLNSEIKHNFIIASGGNMAELVWESPTLEFTRRELLKKKDNILYLNDRERLIKTFQEDLRNVGKFKSIQEFLNSNIHPLMKVDPAAYAKFLNREKVTFLEAAFDKTLPKNTRRVLWENLGRPRRMTVPIDHITWLPFQRLISNIIINEMRFEDIKYRFANLGYLAIFSK
ncbi:MULTISPECIES: dienelactone hydrolase family protein [Petrotoga]|uniref:Dienelactone hydrolase n=1 Tax=Petrotoga sibirica TaxID=156202 RepID=A0A4V3GPX7_9BACT|nr:MULTISPECIES: dienelactone hydrolase family protein [Petrotoga]TDX12913.1 dienelactone hydrolase [Petrotoga sibirica]